VTPPLLETTFHAYLAEAKTMAIVGAGPETDYAAGYLRGLHRAQEGERFGTAEEHAAMMALDPADKDRYRAARARGYRDGLAGAKPTWTAPTIFPKRCAVCGHVYTEAEWKNLRLRGHTGDEVETLEWRDCAAPCGNTLVLAVERPRPARTERLVHYTKTPGAGDWARTACGITHAAAGTITSGAEAVTCPQCLARGAGENER
jgi:hypothetical protein